MFGQANDKTLWCGGVSLALALCLFGGCEREENPFTTVETAEALPPPPRPTLALAGDPQMTLFGEIPGLPAYEFESRSVVSLRQYSYPSEGSDSNGGAGTADKRRIQPQR